MSKIRTIKPSFWDDEKISRLEPYCRLFFIGTWNFADDNGVIRGKASWLKNTIFPYDEELSINQVREWLDLLIDQNLIVPFHYNEESFFLVRSFSKHQRIDGRHKRTIVPDELIIQLLAGEHEATSRPQRGHAVDTSGPRRGHSVGKEGKGNGRERKGKEEKTTTFSFSDQILNDEDFLNLVQYKFKITPEEIPKWLEEFVLYKRGLGELNHRSFGDFKSNFFNWIPYAQNQSQRNSQKAEAEADQKPDQSSKKAIELEAEQDEAVLDQLLQELEDP